MTGFIRRKRIPMENEEYPEDWIDKLKYATAVCEAELDEESSIASLYVLDGIKDGSPDIYSVKFHRL